MQNGENGKARKIAAVRSLFKYFYKKQKIQGNPAMLVDTPKIHEKNIIRLDAGVSGRLLPLIRKDIRSVSDTRGGP